MIDLLIERLQKCRQLGHQRWVACCPAHEDKTPSLSVKITTSGVILIHCHAGCEPAAILSSVGLKWADLFPDEWQAANAAAVNQRTQLPPIDPLKHECTILKLARGKYSSLSLEDKARVKLAIERMGGNNGDF